MAKKWVEKNYSEDHKELFQTPKFEGLKYDLKKLYEKIKEWIQNMLHSEKIDEEHNITIETKNELSSINVEKKNRNEKMKMDEIGHKEEYTASISRWDERFEWRDPGSVDALFSSEMEVEDMIASAKEDKDWFARQVGFWLDALSRREKMS